MKRLLGNWYKSGKVTERETEQPKQQQQREERSKARESEAEQPEVERLEEVDMSREGAVPERERPSMADVNQSLQEIMKMDGAVGAALVDWQSGMTLGTAGGGPHLNLDVAAAGNTDVVRSKLKVMQNLGLNDKIEDILITLTTQYHLIRLLERDQSLFVYVVLSKESANLAMARYKLSQIEHALTV